MQMREHVDRGCQECTEAKQLWETLAAVASPEPSDPPADALRVAQSYLAAAPWMQPPATTPHTVLVFDSARHAAAAGRRGGSAPARRLLYRAGTLWIDLRLEFTAMSPRMVLVGQILDATRPAEPPPASRLWLLQGGRQIPAVFHNLAGEFEFEFDSKDDVELNVLLEGRSPVLIPLGDVTSPTARLRDTR